MANGSTALFQQAVRMLLQGREPSPLAPVPIAPSGGFSPPGGFSMPILEAPPSIAPVAPPPARDESLIEQLTGPRPVAPVAQPDPLILKIARALQGFGAGTQGFGPQFLAGLREERERPMREFQAKQEIFQNRRAQAIEFAERKAEREQAQTQAQADAQSEREFRMWQQRTGVTDSLALEQMRQAFETERDARRAEAERRETERRDRIQQERDAKQIENQYFGLSKNRALSVELGRYWSGLKDSLSPAAAAIDKRLASLGDVKMRRSMGGGGTSGASNAALKAAQEVEAAKGALISLLERGGDPRQERAARQRIDRAIGNLRKFPGQLEGGLDAGGWPWVKIVTPQGSVGLVPQPAPRGQQAQPTAPASQPQGPQLNEQQQDLFNQIKQQQPQAGDAQVIEYMKRKGWL